MSKRLTVDQLEPVARIATRDALEKHAAEFDVYRHSPDLTLGTIIEHDKLTFQLYIAGERPSDAIILSSATVSRITGDLIEVEVYLPQNPRNQHF